MLRRTGGFTLPAFCGRLKAALEFPHETLSHLPKAGTRRHQPVRCSHCRSFFLWGGTRAQTCKTRPGPCPYQSFGSLCIYHGGGREWEHPRCCHHWHNVPDLTLACIGMRVRFVGVVHATYFNRNHTHLKRRPGKHVGCVVNDGQRLGSSLAPRNLDMVANMDTCRPRWKTDSPADLGFLQALLETWCHQKSPSDPVPQRPSWDDPPPKAQGLKMTPSIPVKEGFL